MCACIIITTFDYFFQPNQQFPGEIIPNMYDKDSAAAANAMYYQFPSFNPAMAQHYSHPSNATQYTHQFYGKELFLSVIIPARFLRNLT